MPDRQIDKQSLWGIYLIVGGFLLLSLLFSKATNVPTDAKVPYTQFKQLTVEGQVERVTFSADEISADLREATVVSPSGPPVSRITTRIPAIGDLDLLPLLEQRNVEIDVLPDESDGASQILLSLLPWVFLIGIYWFFWRRVTRSMGSFGGRMDPNDFLSGSTKKESGDKSVVKFADVAGQDNAKREVEELVEFLREPDRYLRLGAEPPRGILLMGPSDPDS